MIEEADVFQLFWSQNSMRSEFVRREWVHAISLTHKGPGFIRPTYWEEPFPQDETEKLPPPELLQLHFTRLGAADVGTIAISPHLHLAVPTAPKLSAKHSPISSLPPPDQQGNSVPARPIAENRQPPTALLEEFHHLDTPRMRPGDTAEMPAPRFLNVRASRRRNVLLRSTLAAAFLIGVLIAAWIAFLLFTTAAAER